MRLYKLADYLKFTFNMKAFRILLICAGLLVSISCKRNKTKNPEPEVEPFDKAALLNNLADNLIIPAYQDFLKATDSVLTHYNAFKSNPSVNGLQIVKTKLHIAYTKYQLISLFEFGPAEQEIVRMNFNVFPTDTVQIKSNIASGSYNLNAVSNLDAKGFPALDYLFYGFNKQDQTIVQSFINSGNQKNYVSDLLNEMRTKTANIVNTWNTGYRASFVNSLSTDVGSSIGFLVNQLNFELDYLKNAKIGIPLGKKSLDVPLPDKCEAYYGKQSVSYALETLKIIESVYLGRGLNGSDGLGFDDYLDHLKVNHTNGSLNDAIKSQFGIARTRLTAINGVLASEITANPATVNSAYTELVKLLVLLKTDMPSHLGVIITYQDGDGD